MNFVDSTGRWIYQGDPHTGLALLVRSKQACPVLDLRGISLSSSPKCLPNINGLQELYFDQNNLSELPSNIGSIPQLRLLSLGRNSFTTLPESIQERWATLQILYLGHNHFTTVPFDEDWMTAFQQGSIGSNPIPEPISPLWMMKSDADEFFERIRFLFASNTPKRIEEDFFSLAYNLIHQCQEPMIYERLFDGVWIEEHDTLSHPIIHWNTLFNTSILQSLGRKLLSSIPRGSIVDPSLNSILLSPLC